MLRRGNRRGVGLPPTQPLPPRPSQGALSEQPTMTVQRQRIDAFMGQLLAAGGRVATRVDAQRYLRRWDWEVDEAVTEWMREQREGEGIDVEDFDVEEMSVSEDSEEEEGEQGRASRRTFSRPTRRTGEEERRDAAAFLIRRLRVAMPDPRLTLTRYESLALLYYFQFDMDAAVEYYRAQDGNVSEITDPWRPLRRRTATQRQRDERLALYISITQTNDWYTALMLLEQVGWDLAEALYLWHDAGEGDEIEHVPHPSRLIPGWGSAHEKRQKMGWRMKVNGTVWKDDPKGKTEKTKAKEKESRRVQKKGKAKTEGLFQEEEIIDPDVTESEDEAVPPPREYNYAHSHEGAIINVSARGPGRNPHLHAPDPGWLSIEVIRDGEYKFRPYNRYRFTSPPPSGRPAPPPDSADDDDDDDDDSTSDEASSRRASSSRKAAPRPPNSDFSWSNPDHIHNLTVWRRQALSRLVMGPAGTSSTSATIPTLPSPATHHIPSTSRAPPSGIPRGTGLMGHGKPPAWTSEEETFLFDLHEEYRNELLAQDPHRFDSDPHMGLPAAKKAEWVQRMNRHFDYTRQGRPEKTEKAIVAKRGRMKRICERRNPESSLRLLLYIAIISPYLRQ
ncbi:MAG: hypothetical protein Q9160_007971 [Pyrenula sp. 1 TL-2023]